ncbi:pseudouridylate synthase 1 homolog isoform X2 [Argopecten irradians]|uniref:pseudouridylate synthase 1 homolog isoform X2 n=1 Tax=Argopecten irradians TaxID=31199 RepID=UPI003713832A
MLKHWIHLLRGYSKHLIKFQTPKMSESVVTDVKKVVTQELASSPEVTGQKRKLENEDVASSSKKEKIDHDAEDNKDSATLKRKKVALLISYSGKGYFGLQMQKTQVPTIEGVIVKALHDVGVISQEDADTPQKVRFQRAARTDKGVSAAGNIVSLKMSVHLENFLEEISQVLPQHIKVQACIRTTKGFDCKNYCDGRTYSYLTPTFAFAPHKLAVTERYRVPGDTIERVRELIKRFEGTHNFHNFTSGLKPNEAKAKRYIISFKCGEPFVRDDIEFVQLTVRGQSFMLHQIRKMIGITMAIVRGHCGEEVIDKTYSLIKVDVPKAPGSGLLLEELHYQNYNKRYGNDGVHQSLDAAIYREAIDQFKEEYIYPEMIRSEKEERSMMTWLNTLENHDYDEIPAEKLLNWKYNENKEEGKNENSTNSPEPSELKDIKDSSSENGNKDQVDSNNTEKVPEESTTDKDMAQSSDNVKDMAQSSENVKDTVQSSDNVKDTDKGNKMEVS